MAKFDPYRKWLGIPPAEQPPNHYRLLGIGLFEFDPDVIANAADRQMVHVRTFQSGKRAKLSQRILNELAGARVCLLDPRKRARYEEQLRRELSAAKPVASRAIPVGPPPPKVVDSPPPVPPPVPPPPVPPPPVPPPSFSPPPVVPRVQAGPSTLVGRRRSRRGAGRRKRSSRPEVAVILILLGVALCLLLIWMATRPNSRSPKKKRSRSHVVDCGGDFSPNYVPLQLVHRTSGAPRP